MEHENVFRLVLLSGLMLVIPVMLHFRIKAAKQKDRLNRREEGLFILFTLRPIGAFGMLGLFAYLINPRSMAWSSLPLPNWSRWCGVGIGALSAAFIIATVRSLGTNLTDTVVTRAQHTLVTTGPYRWIRHPFYVGFAGAVFANALTAANAFIGATGAIAVLLLVVRSRTEERKLLERFGDAYASYRSRTGAFIPRRPMQAR
jgi:protein-S-isoprenylcysteine O-methyltransferase Ste14